MTTLAIAPKQQTQLAAPDAAPPHQPRINRIAIALLAVILTGGFFVRFAKLGRQSLWFDEGYTAWAISLPPAQLVNAIRVDTAPPLYYLLLRQWTAIFGHSEAALRSMSAVFSSAALLLCWMIARRLLRDQWAALAATALAGAAFMPVAYAHEARFYAMMLLLAAADFYLVLLAAERDSLWRLVLLGLCWIASLYTNNIMTLYVGLSAIAWLIVPGAVPLRRRIVQLAIVGALAAAAFAPWVPAMLAQSHRIQGNFWLSSPQGWDLANAFTVLAGINANTWRPVHTVMVVVMALLATAVLGGLMQQRRRQCIAVLTLIAIAPVLVLFLVSRISQPVFVERVMLPSTVFFAILWATPLAWLQQRWARICWGGVLFVLLGCEVWSMRGQWLGEHLENWRGACAYLQSQRDAAGAPKRSIVIFASNEGEQLYDYYARHGDFTPRSDLTGAPTSFFQPPDEGPPRTMRRVRSDADLDQLRSLLAHGSFDQLFLVQSHQQWGDPSHRVLRLLMDDLDLQTRRDFLGITVFQFDRVQ